MLLLSVAVVAKGLRRQLSLHGYLRPHNPAGQPPTSYGYPIQLNSVPSLDPI